MFCGICFDLRQNPDCTVAIFICLNVSRDELNKWEKETEKKRRVTTQQHKTRKWKTDNNTNYSSITFDWLRSAQFSSTVNKASYSDLTSFTRVALIGNLLLGWSSCRYLFPPNIYSGLFGERKSGRTGINRRLLKFGSINVALLKHHCSQKNTQKS